MAERLAFFVFDIESVADAALIAKVHYDGKVDAVDAVQKYQEELRETNNTDFIPYTFQIPISVAVGKVAADLALLDIVLLDEPQFRPHEICSKFWRGWTAYNHPTLVSFNGRGFDLPLLELAAFRYGIAVPHWFAMNAKSFEQPRYRYNTRNHLDLFDVLTNFGATRFNGGLNLAANILGKPGKMEIQGFMVQQLYDEGRLAEINDYCRCDVLDTYFVFLRTMVLTGSIALEQEQVLVTKTKEWLKTQAENSAAYRLYLDNWGDWPNPWGEGNRG